MFSIGVLSKQTGVKVPTIRYYEQMGLIPAPARSDGNQRRYPPAALDRLSFIKHARELGLSIEAVKELLELSESPERTCRNADQIAAEHLEAVREKIAKLQRLEAELDRIASGCEGGKIEQCYVLQALADHGMCANEH